MAGGGWTLDLSLATAGTSASAGERRTTGWRAQRRTVSSLFAELGAMLPNLPTNRVSDSAAVLRFSLPPPATRRGARRDETSFFLSPLRSISSPLLV